MSITIHNYFSTKRTLYTCPVIVKANTKCSVTESLHRKIQSTSVLYTGWISPWEKKVRISLPLNQHNKNQPTIKYEYFHYSFKHMSKIDWLLHELIHLKRREEIKVNTLAMSISYNFFLHRTVSHWNGFKPRSVSKLPAEHMPKWPLGQTGSHVPTVIPKEGIVHISAMVDPRKKPTRPIQLPKFKINHWGINSVWRFFSMSSACVTQLFWIPQPLHHSLRQCHAVSLDPNWKCDLFTQNEPQVQYLQHQLRRPCSKPRPKLKMWPVHTKSALSSVPST